MEKDVLTSLFAIVAQRPNCTVLCADEEVEDAVLYQGDGTDTTGLQRKFRHDLQPREVRTSTSPAAVPTAAASTGPKGPRSARRTVGRSSKVVRVGLPSIGFQTTLPSFIATNVPSLVVKLRDDGSLLHMLHESLEVHLVLHTPRERVKVKRQR